MIIIAGLGNPGKEYAGTRHNTGYTALDAIARRAGIRVESVKFQGLTGTGMIAGQKVLLVKPITYMNNSGDCLRAAADYYHVEPQDIYVIFDDAWLAPGRLRIRKQGSAGGHNGLKSIISRLGTQEFPRIRIGIGEKPAGADMAAFVLGHVPSAEKQLMADAAEEAARAMEMILTDGIAAAMNVYNRDPEKEAAEEKAPKKAAKPKRPEDAAPEEKAPKKSAASGDGEA